MTKRIFLKVSYYIDFENKMSYIMSTPIVKIINPKPQVKGNPFLFGVFYFKGNNNLSKLNISIDFNNEYIYIDYLCMPYISMPNINKLKRR